MDAFRFEFGLGICKEEFDKHMRPDSFMCLYLNSCSAELSIMPDNEMYVCLNNCIISSTFEVVRHEDCKHGAVRGVRGAVIGHERHRKLLFFLPLWELLEGTRLSTGPSLYK